MLDQFRKATRQDERNSRGVVVVISGWGIVVELCEEDEIGLEPGEVVSDALEGGERLRGQSEPDPLR